MPNLIVKTEKGVQMRIDGCYVTNATHMVSAYARDDGTSSFFGDFKFLRPQEAKETLRTALKQLGTEDNIFDGQYPKWIDDNYGEALKVQNKVRFFKQIGSDELVPDDEIRDYIYSIEVHMTPTTEGKTYLRVPRAIASGASGLAYNDELFTGDDSPF